MLGSRKVGEGIWKSLTPDIHRMHSCLPVRFQNFAERKEVGQTSGNLCKHTFLLRERIHKDAHNRYLLKYDMRSQSFRSQSFRSQMIH